MKCCEIVSYTEYDETVNHNLWQLKGRKSGGAWEKENVMYEYYTIIYSNFAHLIIPNTT